MKMATSSTTKNGDDQGDEAATNEEVKETDQVDPYIKVGGDPQAPLACGWSSPADHPGGANFAFGDRRVRERATISI